MLKSKNEQCTMDILLPMEKRRNFQLLPIFIITLTNQNSLDAGLTYRHPTYISKLKRIVVSPLIKA